jgi:hypothetical protein
MTSGVASPTIQTRYANIVMFINYISTQSISKEMNNNALKFA